MAYSYLVPDLLLLMLISRPNYADFVERVFAGKIHYSLIEAGIPGFFASFVCLFVLVFHRKSKTQLVEH